MSVRLSLMLTVIRLQKMNVNKCVLIPRIFESVHPYIDMCVKVVKSVVGLCLSIEFDWPPPTHIVKIKTNEEGSPQQGALCHRYEK